MQKDWHMVQTLIRLSFRSSLSHHCLLKPVCPKTWNHYSMWKTLSFEPRHDKTNKMAVRPAKTQISLGICAFWSESSLSAWRSIGPLAIHWVHSKDSDQTGLMPRLIWVFAGCTLILLVLSCRGKFLDWSWILWSLCTCQWRGTSWHLV